MTVRNLKTRALAERSGVPYGTLRRILELNTVADYEQLRKIADALRTPLSAIIADAEQLTQDEGIIEDYKDTTTALADEAEPDWLAMAAKHGDIDAEQEAYEELP